MRALLRAAPVLAVAVLLAAGCSSGGQQVVFTRQGGFTFAFPAQTDEVADIGFSFGSLHNTTGQPVHLLSVTFAPAPASLHVLNVLAYSWADLHDIGVYNATGVLARECPARFKPPTAVFPGLPLPARDSAPARKTGKSRNSVSGVRVRS